MECVGTVDFEWLQFNESELKFPSVEEIGSERLSWGEFLKLTAEEWGSKRKRRHPPLFDFLNLGKASRQPRNKGRNLSLLLSRLLLILRRRVFDPLHCVDDDVAVGAVVVDADLGRDVIGELEGAE